MQESERIAVIPVVVALFVVLPAVAIAQDPPKFQAGGGYMYIVDPWAAFNNPVTPDVGGGWYAKVIGNWTPHFGPVGELSGNYYGGHGHKGVRGSARIYSFLGGMRVNPYCCAMVSTFAHAVVGMVHSRFRGEAASFSNATERRFAFAFGGGADIRAVHVAADVMRVRHHENYSAWTWRIAAGVMLPSR